MNMCLIYAPAYALIALALGRSGHYWPARAMWDKAGALALLAPFVAWSPHWALIGSAIWTAVSVDLTAMAARGKIPHIIPKLGYALACSYGLHWVDSFLMLPIPHVPTWVSAIIGVTMVALISGPLAHDAARHIRDRLGRHAYRARLRRDFARGMVGDVEMRAGAEGPPQTRGAR